MEEEPCPPKVAPATCSDNEDSGGDDEEPRRLRTTTSVAAPIVPTTTLAEDDSSNWQTSSAGRGSKLVGDNVPLLFFSTLPFSERQVFQAIVYGQGELTEMLRRRRWKYWHAYDARKGRIIWRARKDRDEIGSTKPPKGYVAKIEHALGDVVQAILRGKPREEIERVRAASAETD